MLLFIILFILINPVKSCPLTDNYLSRCHCGILTNGESYIKCDEKTLYEIPLFKRSFPYDELILINNHIKNLTRTSFDNIKTIRRINLENNSISFIDNDLLRLLGNYLEELIITGDNKINSLEFLTRYPLKNLRIIKLNKFNLSEINLGNIFINMTKLEIVSLRSCQLKEIPNLLNIYQLDLENNEISNRIYLSTSYIHLNLAKNFISSIILQNNSQLISLNLTKNYLKEFFINSQTTKNLQDLNLKWLKSLILYQNKQINTSTWTCFKNNSYISFLSADFQCSIITNPKVYHFNISYVKISFQYGLYIQWSIIDDDNLLEYIQISISEPFYISPKLLSNQTEIFLTNHIQSNKQYHICLILLYKYTRDKYCRVYSTDKLITLMPNEIKLEKNNFYDINLFIMLIGSCIGGLVTFILILICFYLCIHINKYNLKKTNEKNISYYSKNSNLHYPIYHTHSITCPYHQENISNSTDSSQMDGTLSRTNLKHIYQTIDNHDYSSLRRDDQLFELWNQSLKQKR
ncbi:unnamed protein product [Rotaria sp. Silwood2]|nr:unnamed protein product [Rotaria sp. Silwood2]